MANFRIVAQCNDGRTVYARSGDARPEYVDDVERASTFSTLAHGDVPPADQETAVAYWRGVADGLRYFSHIVKGSVKAEAVDLP